MTEEIKDNDGKPPEEAKKEEKPEAASDSKKGDKPSSLEIVREANEARQGLATENDRLEKNIAELKELKAIDIISGTAEAGKTVEKVDENSDEALKKYAQDALEGKFIEK